MNRRKRFFVDGIMLTSVGIAVRGVAMLLAAYLSRAVGSESIGLYSIVMTVYSFAITFATSGISLTVTRLTASLCSEGREDSVGSLVLASALYSSLFGLAATLLLSFGSELISGNILSAPDLAPSFRLLSLSLIPASLSAVISGYFIGVKRVRGNAVTQVTTQLFRVFATLIFLWLVNDSEGVSAIIALCTAALLTEIVGFLMLLILFLIDRRGELKKRNAVGSYIPEIAKNTVPVSLSQYVRSALVTLEHMLIPRRLIYRGEGREEAYSHYGALHGMALPTVLFAMAPLTSFSGLLVAEFAEDKSPKGIARMSRIASEALGMTLTYAVGVMMTVALFSEELGYVIYGSHEVGRHITILATVIPIMYIDHVTDSMLKGIGEQVYSMWVNISDSLLSIILIWFLIPPLGILGYALVIIIMEGYNFTLSFIRLRRKIPFTLSLFNSALLPLLSAFISAYLSKSLLAPSGSTSNTPMLVLKLLFSTALFVFFLTVSRLVGKAFKNRLKLQKTQHAPD